jgi:hypothetical protein
MSVEPHEIGEAARSACPHLISLNSFLSKDRGAAMFEWAWAALGLLIVTLLFFGLVALLHDAYGKLETWRAGHRRYRSPTH